MIRLGQWACMCAFVAALLSCDSPDAREILFVSWSGPHADSTTVRDIFAMNPDGGQHRQLTHNADTRRHSNFPTWSPDGATIAFLVNNRRPGDRGELHMMDATGNDARVVVRLDSLDVMYPEWSPDGRRLAFIAHAPSDRPDRDWVYTVSRDGTMLRRVPKSGGYQACAGWLPDSETVLVSQTDPGGRSRILRMDVSSGDADLLVETDTLAFICPVAAPDGSSVLFAGARSDPSTGKPIHLNMYRMDPDGTGMRRFGSVRGFAQNPRWSPDGRGVVFHGSDFPDILSLPLAAIFDSLEIFKVDHTGQNLVQLTRNTYADAHPMW